MAVLADRQTTFEAQIEHREWRESKQTQIAYAYDWFGFAVPFLAPMVPASLTFAAIYANYPALLQIPDWAGFLIGLIAAAAIEALGVLSIETFFDMRQYNATLKQDEGRAPEGWAGLIVGIYLIVVLWLVVVLKMNHDLVVWSLIPLAILGFISSAIMVLRKQHSDREFGRKLAGQSVVDKFKTELAKAQNLNDDLNGQVDRLRHELNDALAGQVAFKNEVDTLAKQARSTEELNGQLRADNAQLTVQIERLQGELNAAPVVQFGRSKPAKQAVKNKLSKADILNELPRIKAVNPGISQQQLAVQFGVSKGTINNYLTELGLD